jgi:hypothetical protein
MYLFYIDDSGTRDPAVKEEERVYVLAAVGIYEKRWRAFEGEIMDEKFRLIREIKRTMALDIPLSGTEVKSNYLRHPESRKRKSPFLHNLADVQRENLVSIYYTQLKKHRMPLFFVIIDKEALRPDTTGTKLHLVAYRLLLEKINLYMRMCYPSHLALIVADDCDRGLTREIAEHHAHLLHRGGRNSDFRHILEYPFFAESALSHGVQLADLCAYNAYRAFKTNDFSYAYFEYVLPHVYKTATVAYPDGMLVFPPESPRVAWMRKNYAVWTKKEEHHLDAPQK